MSSTVWPRSGTRAHLLRTIRLDDKTQAASSAPMRWSPPVELSLLEARICKKHEKHRRFFRFARLERHELFDAPMQDRLEALYPATPRGTPPKPPALLAMAVLLQAYTGDSDAEVIDSLEHDARWQMVLDCLGTEEAPFGETTFVDFRKRLVDSGGHVELLRRTVERAKASKDFGYKQAAALRIAIDSAPLECAGKVEDTLNLLGRALRLLVLVVATCLRMPRESVIVEAGITLLGAASVKAALDVDWEAPDSQNVALRRITAEFDRFEAWCTAQMSSGLRFQAIEQAQGVADHIREQNTERGPDGVERMLDGVAPDRQISLSEPEARHGRKHETQRIDGYKKFAAVDMDNQLILAAAVLPANVPEAKGADKLQPEVERYGEVGEMAIDRAFLSSQFVQTVEARGREITCRAFHPKNGELFCKSDFAIDVEKGQVRCPAGKLAVIQGDHARFKGKECQACEKRAQCQKRQAKTGRSISISPQEPLLQELAAKEKTAEGRANLRKRVCIEHALSHHCHRQGPVARYRGVAKNDFDVTRIAAVQNLLEIDRRERAAERARAEEDDDAQAALSRVVF
jgi:hypothetical protein